MSSLNALKHGLRARSCILPGEDPAEYETLRRGIHEQFEPLNAYKSALVKEIVDYFWWCLRQERVEAGLLSADYSYDVIDELLKVIRTL